MPPQPGSRRGGLPGLARIRRAGCHARAVTAAKQPDREIALDRVRIRETAARTIEAGLGYGISALFVCEGLLSNGDPGARHVVIGPH
jgi:hypothetical protein